MEPLLKKGIIVTYHCTDGERYLGCGDDMTLPAIIVGLIPGVMRGVNLVVFANSTAMLTLRTAVPFGLTSGGWTWLERIAEADLSALSDAKSVYIEDTKTPNPFAGNPSPLSNLPTPYPPSTASTQSPRPPKVG